MYPLFLTVNIVWFVQSPDLFAFGDARGRGEQNSRENNDTCMHKLQRQPIARRRKTELLHIICV